MRAVNRKGAVNIGVRTVCTYDEIPTNTKFAQKRLKFSKMVDDSTTKSFQGPLSKLAVKNGGDSMLYLLKIW